MEGEMKVVGCHDDRRNYLLRDEAFQKGKECRLVGRVQVRRRLIEEQDTRFLSKRAGDHHPLALTVAETSNLTLGEMGNPGLLHRPGDGVAVAGCGSSEKALEGRRPRETSSFTSRYAGVTRSVSTTERSRARSRRGTAWRPYMRDPATRIVPSRGGSNPAMERRSVVLPLPLGPTRLTSAPLATVISSLSITTGPRG
jgi:hypothetical protein